MELREPVNRHIGTLAGEVGTVNPVTPDNVATYYQAAILGLRGLEAVEGRGIRFSTDADARWARFRGKLHEGDRLQLLLRDAAAPWPTAFAASRIFRLPGVALDEPFGPSWPTPNEGQAARYLAVDAEPSLAACAALLGVTPASVELPDLRPTTELVVGGGAAILATADAFTARPDLDWARQVTVIADAPAHRQLAGLASLFVRAAQPCPVVESEAVHPPLQGTVVLSSDAQPAVRDALSP